MMSRLVPPPGSKANALPLRSFLDGYLKDAGTLEVESTLAGVLRYAPQGIALADPVHEANAQDLADLQKLGIEP